MNKTSILFFALLAFSSIATAAKYITADEVKTLMNEIVLMAYTFRRTGNSRFMKPRMVRIHAEIREWRVDAGGQHCTTNKKRGGFRCSHVKDAGNDEYQKINNNGDHTYPDQLQRQ